MLSIGEVARRAGTTRPTIRYYDQRGLLPPAARVGGQRRYGEDVLVTLRLIRMAQEAGFTLDEINTLLNGYSAETLPGERWQDLAARKMPEVDAMIARLQAVRQVLEESLRCDCLTLTACAELGWSVSPRSVAFAE